MPQPSRLEVTSAFGAFSKSHVSNYPDGELVGPREDAGEGRTGKGEGDF